MGCGSSQPQVEYNPDDFIVDRTKTKTTWDPDFQPKASDKSIVFNRPSGTSSTFAIETTLPKTPSDGFNPQDPFSTTANQRRNHHQPNVFESGLHARDHLDSQNSLGAVVRPPGLEVKPSRNQNQPLPLPQSQRQEIPYHQSSSHTYPPQNAQYNSSLAQGLYQISQTSPPHAQQIQFLDRYHYGKQLGKGAYAKVHLGIEKSTGNKFAIKHITDRKKMNWNNRDALLDEIGNLTKLRDAPSVVYLHEYFIETNQCYMVLELLPGKEFFERIIQKSTFTESEARKSCRCVLNALSFMHQRRITHRDLKPENLLLVDELDTDYVKVADFGFSKTLNEKNGCRTLCGTPGYLAPEVLERWPAYDVDCDMWSFGVILFLLLGAYLPFDSHGTNDIKQVFERTRNGEYYFYPQRWKGISHAAKDLIAKCLTVNPENRISPKAALSHEWMGEDLALPQTMISSQSLASAYHETKRYNHQRHVERNTNGNDGNRLKDLNDDFTVYLEDREIGSLSPTMAQTTRRSFRAFGRSNATPDHSNMDNVSGKLFGDLYTKESQIGQGGFATVFRCVHQSSGRFYAVKQVNTSNLTKAEASTLKDEITALKYLQGAPCIIRLYDSFEEGNTTYLVLEEMKGGNVLSRILEKEVYTEREARNLCRTLFTAVKFCHMKKIAHRDIKLENLLLQEKGNDSSIKLADFGFAKKVKKENGLKTMLGTPSYMAPEIYDLNRKDYDERCDIWSVGVVVYCLLGGYLPFEGNIREMAQQILRGKYHFHDEYWRDVSPSSKRLISSLLQVDPSQRLSMQQALTSRWMTTEDSELTIIDLSLTRSKMLEMTHATSKFKNAVKAVIGVNRLKVAVGLQSSIFEEEMTPIEAQRMLNSLNQYESESEIEVKFADVYAIGKPVGEGSLAKVYQARNLVSKRDYSVKKIVRRDLHPADFAALSDEIAVLEEISQSGRNHVVCLYEVYEDPDATYLVMEKIHGDILIDKLVQKKKYVEFDAKELIRNLLLGVNHCHRKRIAIRNLTLDNLMLPQGSDSDVIITDFEIAKKVLHRNGLRTQCGTQEFVAPEVLSNRPAYDVSCDIWTVGVIGFILLGGYYPFRGKTDEDVLRNIRYGDFEFREKLWKDVSEDAKLLLRKLMTVNPDDRLSAEATLQHRWINLTDSALSNDLTVNMIEIKKEASQKFKAAARAVIATQRLSNNHF